MSILCANNCLNFNSRGTSFERGSVLFLEGRRCRLVEDTDGHLQRGRGSGLASVANYGSLMAQRSPHHESYHLQGLCGLTLPTDVHYSPSTSSEAVFIPFLIARRFSPVH